MLQRRATIKSASGLHARPASYFTQAAAATGMPVTIGREGQPPVAASSVLMVMGLGLRQGEEVVLTADAPEAGPALDELAALLATDLDAETPA